MYFELESDALSWETLVEELREKGVLIVGGFGRRKKLRCLTHLNVSSSDIDTTLMHIESIITSQNTDQVSMFA